MKSVVTDWQDFLLSICGEELGSETPTESGTVDRSAHDALEIAKQFGGIQLPFACVGLTLQPDSSGSLSLLLIELKMSLLSCVRLQSEVHNALSRYGSFDCNEVLLPVAQMQLQLSAMITQYDAVVQSALEICKSFSMARDLSAQFTEAYSQILKALKESSSVPKKRIDTSTLSKGRAVDYLQDKLARHQVTLATLYCLHCANADFSVTNDDRRCSRSRYCGRFVNHGQGTSLGCLLQMTQMC